jgi:hypothetical protein
MAAASRAASLSWAPSNPRTRGRRDVFSRPASVAHGLRRGEMFGSRVHREGSLCFIGALPKPVRKVSAFFPPPLTSRVHCEDSEDASQVFLPTTC